MTTGRNVSKRDIIRVARDPTKHTSERVVTLGRGWYFNRDTTRHVRLVVFEFCDSCFLGESRKWVEGKVVVVNNL